MYICIWIFFSFTTLETVFNYTAPKISILCSHLHEEFSCVEEKICVYFLFIFLDYTHTWFSSFRSVCFYFAAKMKTLFFRSTHTNTENKKTKFNRHKSRIRSKLRIFEWFVDRWVLFFLLLNFRLMKIVENIYHRNFRVLWAVSSIDSHLLIRNIFFLDTPYRWRAHAVLSLSKILIRTHRETADCLCACSCVPYGPAVCAQKRVCMCDRVLRRWRLAPCVCMVRTACIRM